MSKELKETIITTYGVQENVKKGLTEKEDSHLGFYLLLDHKVAHCYRNNKTIESVSYPEVKQIKSGPLAQPSNQSTGRVFSTQTIQAKPCGSHCAMFQLFTKGEGKNATSFARLNCCKVEYELSYKEENIIPGGNK